METNNLFFSAMDVEKQMAINEIKENKKFALKLIQDLDKIFQTNYHIEDQQDGVIIRMKKSPNNNWYNCFSFIVNKDGIEFHCNNLGYYYSNHFKHLGWLYEKYKDNGTTADSNFLLEGSSMHGWVHFKIKINRQGDNLNDTLKNIVYLMEHNQYNKKF